MAAPTKVHGSNGTFLNSAYVAFRPRGDVHRHCNPRTRRQKSLTLWGIPPSTSVLGVVPPQLRWAAVAGSSDRPGFSLKPALSAVKHRNLLLLRKLQTSLTRHHSESVRSAVDWEATAQYDTLATKSSLGTILQLANGQYPCNTSEEALLEATRKPMRKCREQSSLKASSESIFSESIWHPLPNLLTETLGGKMTVVQEKAINWMISLLRQQPPGVSPPL